MLDTKLFVLAIVVLFASFAAVAAQAEPAPYDVLSELKVREPAQEQNLPNDPVDNPFDEQEIEQLVEQDRDWSDHTADHSRSHDRDNDRWKRGEEEELETQERRGFGESLDGDPAQEQQLIQEERHWSRDSADHSRSRDRDHSHERNGGRRPPPPPRRRPGRPGQRELAADNLVPNSELPEAAGDSAQDQQLEERDWSHDNSRSRDHDDSHDRNGGRRPSPPWRRPGRPGQRDLNDEVADNLAQNVEVPEAVSDPTQDQQLEERDWSHDNSRSRDRDDSHDRNGGRRPPPPWRRPGRPGQRDLNDEVADNLAQNEEVPEAVGDPTHLEERDWSHDNSRSRDHDDSHDRNGGRRPPPPPRRRPGRPGQRDLDDEVADNLAQNADVPQFVDEADDKAPLDDNIQSRAARGLFHWSGDCKRCSDWYDEDKRDTTWLTKLNAEIQCPCSTKVYWNGHDAADQPVGDWQRDAACLRVGLPLCWRYHPGADGCLRSKRTTSTGARQQCCYTDKGKLLAPGLRSAGTPDKASDYSKHQEVDVKPYNWCCRGCSRRGYCDKYLELRKGSNAHCRA